MKTAIVFGATGLIGEYLVRELVKNTAYSKVKVFVRQKTLLEHPKIEEHIIDFCKIGEYTQLLSGNELFICLGTTIKKAGTYEKMELIDKTYPVEIAGLCERAGVKKMAVVSSIGANIKSRNNYLRIKGMMESEILKIPFVQKAVVRPSVLFGKRKERRIGERTGKFIIKVIGFALVGKLRKYRGIHGQTVARAMISILNKQLKDEIYESDVLQVLGS